MSAALLSININKYALLRNSRGHNVPELTVVADEVIAAGAQGITVHPRLDQRHTRFDDLPILSEHLRTHHPGIEFNIECEDHPELIALVCSLRPDQCTLVPVTPGEITSDHGWPMPESTDRLRPTISAVKARGIRVSLFADAEPDLMPHFQASGADRIEIYTGPYAWAFGTPQQKEQTQKIWDTAKAAHAHGLGVNAGHDLDRHNLVDIAGLEELLEVSIGHAHICRALDIGTRASVVELLEALRSQ